MAKIKPFQAVIYNKDKNKNFSNLVCPPYDVISPEKQRAFHSRDPHNFIHLELALDGKDEDKYLKAGDTFRAWLAEKVLIQDETPALYFYSHQYTIKGEKKVRLGFMGLLHLGRGGASAHGHEHTHLDAKEDRLKLIKQVKANLSPIFIVFPDEKRIVQRIYRHVLNEKPFLEVTDEDKAIHKIWRITSPEMLETIQSSMIDESIFIADGHHRFEVACAYRDEMKKQHPDSSDEEEYNYVMAYFTNTESRGLTILPIHRLLKLPQPPDPEVFAKQLGDYFEIEEVKDKSRFFFLMQKGGRTEHLIGTCIHGKYWLLRLRNIRILDKLIPDKPKEYRYLDVSILNAIVLKKILGVNLDDRSVLTFHPEAQDLIDRVNADKSYIAFLLNPVKMEQIMSVAMTGNKMPPKSTFFYPKVISGLLVHSLE
ncbi:MAG TPA: DUF1015 domain-containing protein [Candidatus Omnitrophota bacterium]|nr:DUF1015 domain-containing protein [Candidatus Omnitrophota bacterium]HPT07680.1 DUF1015 domain-containing protein [Candidatus Omnitrophota bacterium]